MSTIAYRDGVLASDSMLSGDNFTWGSVSKISRSERGGIGGAVGRLEETAEFLAWFTKFGADDPERFPPPRGKDGADGIAVTQALTDAGVLLLWTGGERLTVVKTSFIAIGSGAKIAMGAMAAGATAEEAVEIAAKYDVYTGGETMVLRIDADSSPQSRSIAQ